jgi:DNA-binding Lrp family transcriptional regulator
MLDAVDRQLIVATQAGLPLVPRPYHALAEALGIPVTEVQARLAVMLEMGMIRRIGAVPNHYALGYRSNGMTVWDVEDTQVDILGAQVGALPFVTHCYRRPRILPDWPFNLFAMVHGKTHEEASGHIAGIATLLGAACRSHDTLFSSRILKKTGLRIAV